MIARLGCREPNAAKLAAHPDIRLHPAIASVVDAHGAGLAMAMARILLPGGRPWPPDANELPLAPRLDQGQSGSCTWAATSAAIWVACKSLGSPLAFLPSQRVGYAIVRALERKAAGLPVSTPLEDGGADLEDVFEVMRDWGIAPMERPITPDGRFYDIWTGDDAPNGNVNDEPGLDELEAADPVRVLVDVRMHTISLTEATAPSYMALALSAQPALPVLACGLVDTAFMQLGPNDVMGAPNLRDKNGGGHAFWFSAYRTAASGELEFKLENSWGASWAADGAVWVSEAFVRVMWAAYVPDAKVSVRSKP